MIRNSGVMVRFLQCSKNTTFFFFEVLGTQLFKTDRQSRHAFQAAKFVIIRFVKFRVAFFTSWWFKKLFWEFRCDGSFCYGFVEETPEFDWNRTISDCCTLEQSRHALRHV